MPLSARALLHFTSKLDYLLSILENGFAPRYCLEDISYQWPDHRRRADVPLPIKAAYPMTCFCDIKLSQTQEHASEYGKYVIGLTKEWGEKNGVTPVLYFHEESLNPSLYMNILHELGDLMTTLSGKPIDKIYQDSAKSELVKTLGGFHGALYAMTNYMKPIKGILENRLSRDGMPKEKYFYDEREWRYIPDVESLKKCSPIQLNLFLEQYEDENFRKGEEEKLRQHCSLIFTEEDIKYLIIPNSCEIEDFKQALKDKVTRFEDIEKLFHKIRSYEDIEYDF